MKQYLNGCFVRWKKDYDFKTLVNSTGSFFITAVFALYNGFLGLWYQSVWNVGICFYYLFLVFLRGIILTTEKKNLKRDEVLTSRCRRKTFWLTSIILLFMNFVLVVPIFLMIMNQRPVNIGIIPAISIASYTTYKVIMASINIKRIKGYVNVVIKQLRTINFIDALVSVLTLQNTLINVNNDKNSKNIFILSIISSVAFLLIIVVISVRNVIKAAKIRMKNYSCD